MEQDLRKIRGCKLAKYEDPTLNIKDYEFSECYMCTFDGDFRIDNDEVVDAKFISVSKLKEWTVLEPTTLTPWLLVELDYLFEYIKNNQ